MSKIKSWIKDHKKEILVGVICTIITNGLHNLATLIKEIAPTAGNSLMKFISNSFYTSAAKITDTSLISFLFLILFGLTVASVIGLVCKGFKVTKKAIAESEKIINDLSDTQSVESKCPSEITEEEIKNEAKSIVKESKKLRKTAVILIVYFVCYFGSIMAFDIVPHAVWTEYQQDLIKIAPYIEQHELDMIKSDWVCMQTKEDYDAIYERINQVKEEHDLP